MKVYPRTGQEGPEEEYMYSSTLPSNSTLDEGVGGLRHALAGLPAGKTRYLLYIGGWSGPQVRSGRVRKTLPHRDSIPSSSSPQRIRYTDYAIPRPSFLLITDLITCTLHTNLWQQIAYHKQCKGSYNTLEKQSTHRNKTEHTQKQQRKYIVVNLFLKWIFLISHIFGFFTT